MGAEECRHSRAGQKAQWPSELVGTLTTQGDFGLRRSRFLKRSKSSHIARLAGGPRTARLQADQSADHRYPRQRKRRGSASPSRSNTVSRLTGHGASPTSTASCTRSPTTRSVSPHAIPLRTLIWKPRPVLTSCGRHDSSLTAAGLDPSPIIVQPSVATGHQQHPGRTATRATSQRDNNYRYARQPGC
jgi:hypothetical protein